MALDALSPTFSAGDRGNADMITRLVVLTGFATFDIEGEMPELEVRVSPAPMTLLSSGVPLTLLLDLFLGPQSEDLFSHEPPLASAE